MVMSTSMLALKMQIENHETLTDLTLTRADSGSYILRHKMSILGTGNDNDMYLYICGMLLAAKLLKQGK